MAEVKWIKVSVDMFDNRKIKHIRKLPNGDTMTLIWIMLLTMAGRCNDDGMIYLTQDIPYSTKMLADEFQIKEGVVKSALDTFERLDMIKRKGELISVTGWSEHQNVTGLDRVREQTKKRVAKHREVKNNVTKNECNVTCNVTDRYTENQSNGNVTQCNATDIETDIERDKDIDIESETIYLYGTPTLDQVTQYCNEKNSKVDPQRFFNYYQAKGWIVGGEPMRDWKAMIDCWEQSENEKKPSPAKERVFNTMQSRNDIDFADIEKRAQQQLYGGGNG